MYIELRSVNFENKGAELMLHAIIQEASKRWPDAKLVIEPSVNTFSKRADLGLYQKLSFKVMGIDLGLLIARFVHPKLKNMFGLVSEKDIDIVLDASGLAYSDQWGPRATKIAAAQFKRMNKNGSNIILLPQAIGPLQEEEIQSYFKEMCKYVDCIFARDSISYKYCTEVCGDLKKIKQSPDFTNLLKGVKSESFDPGNMQICVIPNYRMIDKVDKSNRYIPLMVQILNQLTINNEKAFMLIHEGSNDLWLAKEINKLLNNDIEIITEENPLKIKWIIGQSKAVISSRYHGLVSGLSQGIPSLGTGWNHKYEMLFNDYNCSEALINLGIKEVELKKKLETIINKEKFEQVKKRLSEKAEQEKIKSNQMWDFVTSKIK